MDSNIPPYLPFYISNIGVSEHGGIDFVSGENRDYSIFGSKINTLTFLRNTGRHLNSIGTGAERI